MTATGEWLQQHDAATVAYVLWLDGLGYGFTTHPDVAGLREAWRVATGDVFGDHLVGGLRMDGSIERRINMFVPKVEPNPLQFGLMDIGGTVPVRKMFMAPARPMGRTVLTASVNAEETTLTLDDVTAITAIPDLTLAYVGLETVRVTAVDYDLGTWTVERGVNALFPRGLGPDWGRAHTIPLEGIGPEVTSEPVRFLNRMCGLYVCHLVGGVWSAGFPDTTDNDAELLWAGRIKHWTDSGDGYISIDCLEITELAQARLGAKLYSGTVAEGAFISAEYAEMQIQVEAYDVVYEPFVVQLASLIGMQASHVEVAAAIQTEMTAALTGANDGIHAPAGATMSIVLIDAPAIADGARYWIEFTWPGLGHEGAAHPRLYLSQIVWRLLGFGTAQFESATAASSGGGWVIPLRLPYSAANVNLAIAANVPRRFVTPSYSPTPITITPDAGSPPFVQQTHMVDGFPGTLDIPGSTVGFLMFMFGDQLIIGVDQLDTDEFQLNGVLGDQAANGGTYLGLGSTTGTFDRVNYPRELFDVPDDGGPPIRVRQVWVEPYATPGEALLCVLASTGTEGYNIPLYDRLPSGMGCGVPASLLDTASILSGMPTMEYLLLITEPKTFTELLQSMLLATGRHLVWMDGKLTVVQPFTDVSASLHIDDTSRAIPIQQGQTQVSLVERTVCEVNPSSVINQVVLQHSRSLDGKWQKNIPVNAATSQTDYDQTRALVVPALGFYRNAEFVFAEEVAGPLLAYFSEPVAMATRTFSFRLAPALVAGRQLDVGDLTIIDPATGELGVTGLRAWCVASTFDLGNGQLRGAYVFQPRASLAP